MVNMLLGNVAVVAAAVVVVVAVVGVVGTVGVKNGVNMEKSIGVLSICCCC